MTSRSFVDHPNLIFLIINLVTWSQFHKHFTSSFYASRSIKRKRTDGLTVFFALLGFAARVKAARKMLMKLTPRVNFINIL